MEVREEYMHRALQLASMGQGRVSPNPMVGAVIVCDDNIIGEGYHRQWGGPHAEVNAVASVADISKLSRSTMYVTLEPCSHYGKTPPCSELIIKNAIPRVVVGAMDPFEKVRGRGVDMLRKAGVEVVTGVLERECVELNKCFMTAHKSGRPYVLLKWAESSDGFISKKGGRPISLSNSLTKMWMHRERSRYDAIMVGTNTIITDNPQLSVREWTGRNPRCVTFDIEGRLPKDCQVARRKESIIITENTPLEEMLGRLYKEYGITSLMVEGGAQLLQSFIDAECYDEVRIEKSTVIIGEGVKAPKFLRENMSVEEVGGHEIHLKRR